MQRALKKALGFDYNEKYFVMGCNSPAMTDFDNWAKETGCGYEPVDGKLLCGGWLLPRCDHAMLPDPPRMSLVAHAAVSLSLVFIVQYVTIRHPIQATMLVWGRSGGSSTV